MQEMLLDQFLLPDLLRVKFHGEDYGMWSNVSWPKYVCVSLKLAITRYNLFLEPLTPYVHSRPQVW